MTGPFIFFDLRTRDAGASRAFYERLAGLTVRDIPAGPDTIPMFTGAGDAPWGGFTSLPEGDPRPPQWIPYLPVTELDAAVTRAVELGGTVVRGRTELPTGSVTVVSDPGGATLALWQDRA